MTAVKVCFSESGFSPKHHDTHRRVAYGPGHYFKSRIFQNDLSSNTTAALTSGGDYVGSDHSR